jgi:hypothetical protein
VGGWVGWQRVQNRVCVVVGGGEIPSCLPPPHVSIHNMYIHQLVVIIVIVVVVVVVVVIVVIVVVVVVTWGTGMPQSKVVREMERSIRSSSSRAVLCVVCCVLTDVIRSGLEGCVSGIEMEMESSLPSPDPETCISCKLNQPPDHVRGGWSVDAPQTQYAPRMRFRRLSGRMKVGWDLMCSTRRCLYLDMRKK